MLHAYTRTGLGWEVGEQTLWDLRTLYQAVVRQVDASIGRLVDTLADNDIADETAVVLAGDQGEEFQEHGHIAHCPKLYDELIQVPLVVDVPGADGRRINGQVSLDVVPPTVADMLDVDAPTEWQGDSLAPSVFDGDAPADEPVVSVTARGEDVTAQPIPRSLDDGDLPVSVRDRDWTYVGNADGGTRELYYRPSDPTQQDDLSANLTTEQRRVIERFESVVGDHAATLRDRAGEMTTDDVDDDLGARLSALGYR